MISRGTLASLILPAFLLSGCEVFLLMGEEDFEKNPEVRRTSELFMDESELRESRAIRAQAKAKRDHEAALVAANPHWRHYLDASAAKDWKKAAEQAIGFNYAPLTDDELAALKQVLDAGGAPAAERQRAADAHRARKLAWPAWPEFLAAYRAGAWAKAENLALAYPDITAGERMNEAEWAYFAEVATKTGRAELAGKRQRAETAKADQDRRLAAEREAAKRDRAAKEAAAYAAEQARQAETNAQRQPVASTPGQAFDFQGKLDKNAGAHERRRCAACLGSGKANYISGGKGVELDVNGKPTGRTYDPSCARCNGTGYVD